jgi:zinc transport system permease protein
LDGYSTEYAKRRAVQMVEKLALYFEFPFVRYALIVGVLIALCSSLLGVTLVLKRFSFIGDGLSHVAFGALAVAAVMGLTNTTAVVLPVTVICAVILLRTGQNSKLHGDASIAVMSVGALAIGYLLMNIFPTSANISGDVCGTLFGSQSILTLTKTDVILCTVLSVAVIGVFVLFYNRIFAVTFDENFARATGTKASAYNLLIAIVIAVIVVLAMNLVGSLLISALVIFPALSAMRVFKTFLSVTVCSAVISVIAAGSGIIISILADTPVGSTVVAVNIVAFALFSVTGKMLKR